MRRSWRSGALAAVAWLATACSGVPRVEQMRVADLASGTPHREPLALEVHPTLTQFDWIREPFSEAVRESLVASKLFSPVVESDDAAYRLDVVFWGIHPLPEDFYTKLDVTVLWSLSRVDTEQTVWQQLLPSSYTVAVGDAFQRGARFRLTLEGALRENIRQAFERMAGAKLTSPR